MAKREPSWAQDAIKKLNAYNKKQNERVLVKKEVDEKALKRKQVKHEKALAARQKLEEYLNDVNKQLKENSNDRRTSNENERVQ